MTKTLVTPSSTISSLRSGIPANDTQPTLTLIAMKSFFEGYDLLLRSDWDGEFEISVDEGLLDSLSAGRSVPLKPIL